MQTRAYILATVAFVLGLLIGSTLAPISLWPKKSLERQNAALLKEVDILKQMVKTFEAERDEVRRVLENK